MNIINITTDHDFTTAFVDGIVQRFHQFGDVRGQVYLLESQSGYIENKKAQEAILESQSRVQSIALIHKQLFQSNKIATIELSSFISKLVQSLNVSMNKIHDKVLISYDADDILLDVSQAIPVGIILNEAITNAFKYAFPENRGGEVKISVKQNDKDLDLQVRDNGIGLPDSFQLSGTTSLGITLIKGLTRQLKGTLQLINNSGVEMKIKFPIDLMPVAR